jgi:hypothetical protein
LIDAARFRQIRSSNDGCPEATSALSWLDLERRPANHARSLSDTALQLTMVIVFIVLAAMSWSHLLSLAAFGR